MQRTEDGRWTTSTVEERTGATMALAHCERIVYQALEDAEREHDAGSVAVLDKLLSEIRQLDGTKVHFKAVS
jgi:hypothetical protein